MDIRDPKTQALLDRIKKSDPKLHEQVMARHAAVLKAPVQESVGGAAPVAMTLETIVRREGRPVLNILNNNAVLDKLASTDQWRDRLKAATKQIIRATRAVGRIELTNFPGADWVGTGWLVAEDIIVTNRHVANLFGRNKDGNWIFRKGPAGQISARIDFLEEADNEASNEMALKEILYIEEEDDPDLAFLRVERSATGKLADFISLSNAKPEVEQFVAVIGYPAKDSRILDQDLMASVFGELYDKKRLAPGQLMTVAAESIEHDCSTLGGNSGSVVVDLDSGDAVGLHHGGTYLKSNVAVPAAIVKERLDGIGSGKKIPKAAPPEAVSSAVMPQQVSRPAEKPQPAPAARQIISCVIPIHVHIEVGSPDFGGATITASAHTQRTTRLCWRRFRDPMFLLFSEAEAFHLTRRTRSGS